MQASTHDIDILPGAKLFLILNESGVSIIRVFFSLNIHTIGVPELQIKFLCSYRRHSSLDCRYWWYESFWVPELSLKT
jgi:hypothetical protein